MRRLELEHAGRRVAAEQRALRAAQHLDLVEVEHREALEDRVLLHDVVVDQRHRLRGVEVEVGVAQAADVEAREGAAEGGFDVQAGQAAREEADVFAAGADDVELLAADRGDRNRHVLDVFRAALGGNRDRLERGRRSGRGGFSGRWRYGRGRVLRKHRQGGDGERDGQSQDATIETKSFVLRTSHGGSPELN